MNPRGHPPNLPMLRKHPRYLEILAALVAGVGPSQLARDLGITKSIVIGIKHRAGLCVPSPSMQPRPSMFERLDALAAKMDAVLEATRPILAADRARWRRIEAQRIADKLAAKRAAA